MNVSPLARNVVRDPAPGPAHALARVAYVVSRFPKLTETFILYEILAVQSQGCQVEIFPLQRERARKVHPEAKPLVERANFAPFLSWAIAAAHLHYLRERPRAYLGALFTLLRSNLGSLRYLAGALVFFPKIVWFARRIEQQGITHVHAHFASHPAAAAFVIRRLTGIPYSFTAHGSDLHRDRHMLREKVVEAAFVVPISEFNRRIIVETCGTAVQENLVVIHCGVDTEVFHPAPEALRSGPLSIVCTGTLHEVKGQKYLLEACRRLAERDVPFACELIGDGPDRAALRRQAMEAGIADRVRFHGQRTRDEVAVLIRNADVLVAPSVPTANGRREGIPVVLMEAIASGTPVVASGISGIPELVEDGEQGFLVPPRDSFALADVLERLYRNPALRRRLGAAGRLKALREFDLETNASALEQRFTRGARR